MASRIRKDGGNRLELTEHAGLRREKLIKKYLCLPKFIEVGRYVVDNVDIWRANKVEVEGRRCGRSAN